MELTPAIYLYTETSTKIKACTVWIGNPCITLTKHKGKIFFFYFSFMSPRSSRYSTDLNVHFYLHGLSLTSRSYDEAHRGDKEWAIYHRDICLVTLDDTKATGHGPVLLPIKHEPDVLYILFGGDWLFRLVLNQSQSVIIRSKHNLVWSIMAASNNMILWRHLWYIPFL